MTMEHTNDTRICSLGGIITDMKIFEGKAEIELPESGEDITKHGRHGDKTCATKHLPKIYTRTGDKGTSVTFTGERRSKDDDIFEALGTTDELSSTIGLARDLLLEPCNDVSKQLEEIQCVLQDLASAVATPRSSGKEYHQKRTEFDGQHVDQLEKWIDNFTQELPPLRNFILPSGGAGSSTLHIARAVCRRAERRLVPLVRCGDVDEAPLRYLNRLSDYLFTVARIAAKVQGKEERIYHRPKTTQSSK